ncbi:MAG: 50S ribosomal protein L15 [Thaumarchaeota archaeon]|nr:50S ribosomal protein L15 [Nitrososphaerota archaeon]
MVTRLRKSRRLRGSRTHGWGQIGQHRAAGHKGGHGKAGLHKHHWTRTVLFQERYFGTPGFHNPTEKITKTWTNVGNLDTIFAKYGKVEDGKNILNLISLGFGKLLGAGNVHNKYTIVVNAFAKNAKTKVENAGGEVLTQ